MLARACASPTGLKIPLYGDGRAVLRGFNSTQFTIIWLGRIYKSGGKNDKSVSIDGILYVALSVFYIYTVYVRFLFGAFSRRVTIGAFVQRK